jgi:hypothetical protein
MLLISPVRSHIRSVYLPLSRIFDFRTRKMRGNFDLFKLRSGAKAMWSFSEGAEN